MLHVITKLILKSLHVIIVIANKLLRTQEHFKDDFKTEHRRYYYIIAIGIKRESRAPVLTVNLWSKEVLP